MLVNKSCYKLHELLYQVSQKMSENLDRGSSCPLYSQGKGFRLWKQEVEAWKICVETPDNKTRLAVDLAIHLPYGHPLKIKERVLDPVEFGVTMLNKDDGVKKLLEFMETKVDDDDRQVQAMAGPDQDHEGQEPDDDSLHLRG